MQSFVRTVRSSLVRTLALGALAAAPVAVVLASSAPAEACGNSYRYELDPKTNMIVKAEESLSEGDFRTAWKLAGEATGAIGKKLEGKDDPLALPALRARALRVAAIAAMRTHGEVAGKADADQVASWAIDELRVLVVRENANPYLSARLAEGLAQKPEGQAEALAILTKLANDDLMPDAPAWLLYAGLTKDDAERERGLRLCKLRANDPTICKLKGPGEM